MFRAITKEAPLRGHFISTTGTLVVDLLPARVSPWVGIRAQPCQTRADDGNETPDITIRSLPPATRTVLGEFLWFSTLVNSCLYFAGLRDSYMYNSDRLQ